MHKELQLWQFVKTRLERGESVMLLVVAVSSGSSPGRAGYKMAVAEDGELIGSIGGGLMEVNLVERSRAILSEPRAVATGDLRLSQPTGFPVEQIHRKNSPNPSGMICSGEQTVILKLLRPSDVSVVDRIIPGSRQLLITSNTFSTEEQPEGGTQNLCFERLSDTDFRYTEILGTSHHLYIVGGGHCALALSELMAKMDFYISLFDDRPGLNTIQKNSFAHLIKIVDSYERISDHIPSGGNAYVVVMTLGYLSDQAVVRSLAKKEFKYLGVLGSKAKMSVMFKSLRQEGIPDNFLDRIRTPIGLPINSRTPEEIAVSIAAEIISVKNG